MCTSAAQYLWKSLWVQWRKLIGSVEGLLIQKQSSFCADKGVFSEDEGVSGVYWRRG